MLKGLFMFMVTLLLTTAAFAFQGFNNTTDLGLFDKIKCSTGLTCSRDNGKMKVMLSATNTGDLVGGGSVQSGYVQKRVLATATTITAAQCGSTFYNGGAIEIELPEASTVLGCRLTFITANAANFDIDPDAADIILIQTNAAGDKTRNATLGSAITIEAISATEWAPVAVQGTWADAN